MSEFLERMLDTLPCGVLVVTDDYRCQKINAEAQRILGEAESEKLAQLLAASMCDLNTLSGNETERLFSISNGGQNIEAAVRRALLIATDEAEEEQAELRLQHAARQLQEIRAALAKAKAEHKLQSQSLSAAAQNGITGGELSWLQACLAAADLSIDQLQRSHQRAEAFFLQQQRAYQQAHQRREILSTLREHHQDAKLLDENRRDQQRADELFVLRKRVDGD